MAYILIKDPKRIAQISLTGLSEESLDIIHQHKKQLFPIVSLIVDELYEEIYQEPTLKMIIEDHSSLEKLKFSQHKYLIQVFEPVIDEMYVQNRLQIGRVHSRIGLDLPWYISTQRRLIQTISNHLSRWLPNERALSLLNAIHALLNFDMQLTVDAYNEIELDKAQFPLRYEFRHLQKKSGLVEEDFVNLEKFSGFLTFQIDEVFKSFEKALIARTSTGSEFLSFLTKLMPYMKNFLKQFFQDRVYRDEALYYRIIRDWSRQLIDNRVSDQKLTLIVDTLNEVLRESFIIRGVQGKKEYINFLTSFERFTRFTLAIMKEILNPYKYLHTYSFLNIYSYEIDMIDFGKLTWMDEKAKQLLSSREVDISELSGKRCYELFYYRVTPCIGCPARGHHKESLLTHYDNGTVSRYYKTWRLPQSRIAELNHRILVSQDITEEAKITFDTIESLLDLAEFRDDDTGQHVSRIGLFAGKLAELAGFDEKFIQDITIAARFHDIGKVGIPDSILNKPGKLSSEEWESMKTHVQIGHQILSKLDMPVIQMASRIANTHHERWDGSGYPSQLKEEEIPVEGRIVSIVDVFDALLSKRAYKDPFPPERVKRIIQEGKGTHFDPTITNLFLSMWDEFLALYLEHSEEVLVSS
ncbi:HD domain-containing phosphohydrolase [Pseudoneobacillus sp. C159]